MIKVLYVEDEQNLALIVSESLIESGFDIRQAKNGDEALKIYHKYQPQVIVLDIMMPIMDGFTLVQELRKTDVRTPIIFLTAMTQTEDVVKGFNIGANDFIRKPFKIEELIARIQAAYRHAYNNMLSKNIYEIGIYTLDSQKNTLSNGAVVEKLTYRESQVLCRLFENQNRVVSRADMMQMYSSNDIFFTGRSLDVFISRIRKYLREDPNIKIDNIRGVGYLLRVESPADNHELQQ